MDLMMDLYERILPRKFGMEVKYIQILTQEIPDLKYVTLLDKRKMNGKYHNFHQRVWEKFYINSLRLL